VSELSSFPDTHIPLGGRMISPYPPVSLGIGKIPSVLALGSGHLGKKRREDGADFGWM
jgi:hypothetical protein